MTNNQLQDQIINDLKNDFPNIEKIKKEEHQLTIYADTDTLWKIFEILYNNIENIELNLGNDEKANIIIKT